MKVPTLGILLALFVSSCSSIDVHRKVPNWPNDMRILEYNLTYAEMYERCKKYFQIGMIPLACAEWDLIAKECRIFYGPFVTESVRNHERMHCAGYIYHN